MSKAILTPRWVSAWVLLGLMSLPGCKGYQLDFEKSWFDPSALIKKPEQNLVNPIFTQVSPPDQTLEVLPNSTKPRPDDLEYIDEDYLIGPTDFLRISIMDLLAEGVETPLERQVSNAGYIDLPLLGRRIKASGLTQEQLTEEIKRAYRPDILKDPVVSVAVALPRQNTFSILGAISRPGTYNILRRDFTLLEALALAGDINQISIPYIYVFRQAKPRVVKAKPGEAAPEELPPLPSLPGTTGPAATTGTGPASRPAGTLEQELKDLERYIPGSAARGRMAMNGAIGTPRSADRVVLAADTDHGPVAGAPQPESAPGAVTYKWIYSGGKWVQVQQSASGASTRSAPQVAPAVPESVPGAKDRYGWLKYDLSTSSRIIAIDLAKLKGGDPRMNVIIRDNDIVQVPTLEVGEFYIMGEVARPGVYSLTGRRITVKMAVAAAGNLGPLSWPNNSMLIRRVGFDQEQMVPLPLDDIFSMKEPDIFLKPDDVIAVGTYWAAPFLAVWRNAFRMTYGAGFIYDRNYSDREFEIPFILPGSRWRS